MTTLGDDEPLLRPGTQAKEAQAISLSRKIAKEGADTFLFRDRDSSERGSSERDTGESLFCLSLRIVDPGHIKRNRRSTANETAVPGIDRRSRTCPGCFRPGGSHCLYTRTCIPLASHPLLHSLCLIQFRPSNARHQACRHPAPCT